MKRVKHVLAPMLALLIGEGGSGTESVLLRGAVKRRRAVIRQARRATGIGERRGRRLPVRAIRAAVEQKLYRTRNVGTPPAVTSSKSTPAFDAPPAWAVP
jgi:hypothetical protein